MSHAVETVSSQAGTSPEMQSWAIVMIDIVGYSTLTEEGQYQAINNLNEVVKNTEVIKNSNPQETILLPTGDGMVVGFLALPGRALELASQIHLAYGQHRSKLKIGIHSGIAVKTTDINGNRNIAGSAVNLAERTLSCCRGGHILVAQDPGGQLKNTMKWGDALCGPYTFQVKHDMPLVAYNFVQNEIGNPAEDFNNLVSLSNLAHSHTPETAFSKIQRIMPMLLAEMKQDISGDQTELIREFVVMPRRNDIFNSTKKYYGDERGDVISVSAQEPFAYFGDDHENLQSKIDLLEQYSLVAKITSGHPPMYRMSEQLLNWLMATELNT